MEQTSPIIIHPSNNHLFANKLKMIAWMGDGVIQFIIDIAWVTYYDNENLPKTWIFIYAKISITIHGIS